MRPLAPFQLSAVFNSEFQWAKEKFKELWVFRNSEIACYQCIHLSSSILIGRLC